jgi:circadian clock protein KaiB
MKGKKTRDDVEVFEQAVKEAEEKKYLLRLYVAGATPKSTQAIMNIKKICEEHLKGRYDLEVVDIYQQPTLAKGEQIIAAPTLVKKLPLPLRRFIGSMADVERILVGLDLKPAEKPPAQASPQDRKKGHKAP